MKCRDFLARFSEYYDDRATDAGAFESHLEGCARCRRYADVIGRGAAIFRSMPGPSLRDDFRPRLQHRIYHVDEESLLRNGGGGTAIRVGTALVAAMVLMVAAWSPELANEAPQVVLPAIIVSQPPERLQAEPVRPRLLNPRFGESSLDGDELWNRALYEYSPLSERYPPARLFRTGLD